MYVVTKKKSTYFGCIELIVPLMNTPTQDIKINNMYKRVTSTIIATSSIKNIVSEI
jgi:hypothetical protein